jgi:hypothetical protein
MRAAGRFTGSRRIAFAPSSCWCSFEGRLPGYEAEETIEDWAAERSVGVYGAGRRSGELERSGKIVKRAVFGRDAVA